MKHWYVIQTKPRQECVAHTNLERQDFECFLPLMNEWRKKRGKKVLTEVAMFPSYLLANIDLQLTCCTPIRSTRGVIAMVRFGNEFIPVPNQIVAAIKKYSQQQLSQTDLIQYKLGQHVQIEAGPFKGLSAIFLEQSGPERAVLLLDMLGKQQKVELPVAALE